MKSQGVVQIRHPAGQGRVQDLLAHVGHDYEMPTLQKRQRKQQLVLILVPGIGDRSSSARASEPGNKIVVS